MSEYDFEPKSFMFFGNEDVNYNQICEDYKIFSVKDILEEQTQHEFYKIKDETPEQTPSNSTGDNNQEEKEKSEISLNNLNINTKAKGSKGESFPLGDENLTKVNNSKEETKEIKNDFIGKKTKNPRKPKQQKKGNDNVDKISGQLEKKEKKTVNKDNSIKESMKAFILIIKFIIETCGDIIFNKFDCNDILGGVKQNELIRKANLYQILGYNNEYRKILRNAKPKNAEKFNYFLSSNFGFLFDKYFLNDNKFKINGKEETVEEFKTLNYEIPRRRKYVYKDYEEKEKEEKINNFIYSSFLVFNDFKDCEQREVKAEKGLVDYRENIIEKFLIYSKKKKNSESNCEKEKEKFLDLIIKINQELNNDNILKSEFAYFEEKEKGFEQLMYIKKIIEEKEKKRIKKVTKNKNLAPKDSNSNLKVKFNIKKKKIKKNETKDVNSIEKFYFIPNFAVNDKNLEENLKEQKEYPKQGEIRQEQNFIDSKNSKNELLEFESNNSYYFINHENSSDQNVIKFEGTNQDQSNINSHLSQSFSCLRINNDIMELNKNEEYLFGRKLSAFVFQRDLI